MNLTVSSPDVEGELQTSKISYLRLLIDEAEFGELLSQLDGATAFRTGTLLVSGEERVELAMLQAAYQSYLVKLEAGDRSLQGISPFNLIYCATDTAVYKWPVQGERFLIKPRGPVVEMRLHRFIFSQELNRFYSMVYGKSIPWGIELSFPQVALNSRRGEVMRLHRNSSDLNCQLFHQLMRWVRQASIPTPFLVNGQAIRAPFRIGKQALYRLDLDPLLAGEGLSLLRRA